MSKDCWLVYSDAPMWGGVGVGVASKPGAAKAERTVGLFARCAPLLLLLCARLCRPGTAAGTLRLCTQTPTLPTPPRLSLLLSLPPLSSLPFSLHSYAHLPSFHFPLSTLHSSLSTFHFRGSFIWLLIPPFFDPLFLAFSTGSHLPLLSLFQAHLRHADSLALTPLPSPEDSSRWEHVLDSTIQLITASKAVPPLPWQLLEKKLAEYVSSPPCSSLSLSKLLCISSFFVVSSVPQCGAGSRHASEGSGHYCVCCLSCCRG